MTFSINKKRYREKTKYEATEENVRLVQEEILPVMIHKIKNGEITLDKVDKKTFEYYSSLFLKSKQKLKPNTILQYTWQIKFWNSHFGKREVDTIKASEIKEVLFNHEVSIASMRDLLNLCKAIFDDIVTDDVISVNPAAKIKLPRVKKKVIVPFNQDEVQELLSKSDNDYFRCYLAIGFYTGLRTGEILALKWQNINLKKRTIYVDATVGSYKEQTTKTEASTRHVPIFEPLIPFLKEQQARNGLSKYVFCTKTGRNMESTNLIKHKWKPLLKKLHLPYRRLYETRHTFATNMIASNKFNLNQIASWLGHSNIQTLITKYNSYIPSEIAKFDTEFDVFGSKNDTENDTGKTEHLYKDDLKVL